MLSNLIFGEDGEPGSFLEKPEIEWLIVRVIIEEDGVALSGETCPWYILEWEWSFHQSVYLSINWFICIKQLNFNFRIVIY